MIVSIKGLEKSYGDFKAINGLDLDVQQGEILGLLGPNGSGKTTTINCLLSLLTYEKGSIEIFDKPMSPDANDIKKDIGLVMQNVAVFEELTVYQNIDYFCGLYIQNSQKRKEYVKEAIQFVGIEDFQKKYPKELSGGLLRRLNIACGIAHKPKLIILDEPTVAVDPQSRNRILENILELNRLGATVIYTTHYMEEVEQICDRIVIMDKGKVIAQGTKDSLKESISIREKIIFELEDISQEIIEVLKAREDLKKVQYAHGLLELEVQSNNGTLIEILNYFKKEKVDFIKVHSESPTLNDVFLELTGTELRD
ncbi:ABC-2 type transport system ATP-binding protein [Breznakia blatticola]|uniref:ABC-2 type transport system ATP-binding protein n=1 Tax=Breznakia blatticola TaxID=1754012 RepID=A0A4R7ZRN3_9FIRM|nr:ABC transporter ATP-binding protein [Breznakia blatticola]TDW20637.1 ABC-2 type transport system ATP-binding protein [Breznakia blatticola]